MKYMIAKHILQGQMTPVTVDAVATENMTSIVKSIKGVSNDLEFMKTTYNLAGVPTMTMKDSQYLIMSAEFDAAVNVDVLAAAFNMDKAEFAGHSVMVDSFGTLDMPRLKKLFANDPTFVEYSDDQLAALDAIPAVLVDIDWFMIFDNMMNFSDIYNPQGLYWNYFLHQWKTFSVSPFANAAMFIPSTPAVTSVKISPTTVTTAAGQTVQLAVTVETENFAPQTVNWTSDTDGVTVDIYGKVTIAGSVASSTKATITATSTYDNQEWYVQDYCFLKFRVV
jgi:hypothetical protein